MNNNIGKNNPMYGKPPVTFIDVTGQRFGKLTVIDYEVRVGFICQCDCGKQHIENTSYNLRKGLRVSCGHCNGRRTDRYTSDEDKVIINNAGKLTIDQIGKLINRTAKSVQTRGQLLKKKGLIDSLYCYGENHHCSVYSNEDVELVRQLHDEGLPMKLIAEKMEIPYQYVQKLYLHIARVNDPVTLIY